MRVEFKLGGSLETAVMEGGDPDLSGFRRGTFDLRRSDSFWNIVTLLPPLNAAGTRVHRPHPFAVVPMRSSSGSLTLKQNTYFDIVPAVFVARVAGGFAAWVTLARII